MPTVIEALREKARANPKKIVFPESHDPRVIEAVKEFKAQGLGHPILLAGHEEDSTAIPTDIETIAIDDRALIEKCATQLFENRKHRGLTAEGAEEAVSDPLLMASLLVRTGVVDGCVAGSIATTPSVIRAGLYGVGPRPGRKLVSSFFLMQLPTRALTYSDCGVVPDPSATELAEIAVTAAENHELLTGETAHVAMLSFSTLGSANHDRVDKVREALTHVRKMAPDLIVDGELQFDAAFVPEVAARKAPNSPVAGKANVFVFPDLDAGNIAYKITERLGGAQALGPLVQGLAKPCMDLSRGCSPTDIVDVGVIAAIMAGKNG